jgi:hypothetical protein
MNMTGYGTDDHFGFCCSNAGDVNGDGYQDVIIGGPADYGNGRAFLFFGGENADNVADLTFYGTAKNDGFGCSVSGAGDVNGDGYDDVIVGADEGESGRGGAYIFFGGQQMDNNTDLILNGTNGSDYFGTSVSAAGDVNNDGYDDVIVGASWAWAVTALAGRAYIFFGGQTMNKIADVYLAADYAPGRFGTSVSGAGDVNGDGFDDDSG